MGIQHIMPKFHACWQTQRPRLGWPCNHQAPPHFFLDFCQDKHPRNLSISTGPCKIRILTSNFTLFSLKKSARNSLKLLLSTHGSTLWKKDKTPSYFFFVLPQRKKTQEALSPFSYPRVKHQKERKLSTLLSLSHLSPAARRKLLSTLSSSLPLILSGPATRKGKSFHVSLSLSLSIYLYIYMCCFKKLWAVLMICGM